jgi:Putative ATP-dependent DNA helicase recG C-terminal
MKLSILRDGYWSFISSHDLLVIPSPMKAHIGCAVARIWFTTTDLLQRIFAETGPDFSAEICPKATLADLALEALENFRQRWMRKTENPALGHLAYDQLLIDGELLVDGGLTYAALILFGTRRALGKYLGEAEVLFEYRSQEASIPCQQREEYRQGFFSFMDDLWQKNNTRNDRQHFADGLFIWDIPTFNEMVVREAVLNAMAHRDYRLGASIFVRQFPRKLEIVSPGGFPPGITPENILWRQSPRNRRIAEALSRCSLVERSGQGVNRMFEECIKESKPWPDFAGSDDYQGGDLAGGGAGPQIPAIPGEGGQRAVGLLRYRRLSDPGPDPSRVTDPPRPAPAAFPPGGPWRGGENGPRQGGALCPGPAILRFLGTERGLHPKARPGPGD